ncbi:hypothetical protein ANCDUO_04400 [Ancylostoma duodenale]|uniref:Carbonic anhydrase n=1 Tax=Ancylostoma duodenale TaxID=51022 RepID=A0A0C2D6N4_9BILA|nr:hypothetical protein ANCDUO_04400 [Ancylostoma duodenale]
MRVPLMTSCDGSFSSGGGLSGKYYLQQFHFHWGDSDTTGSEHTLDLLHYPVEVHFVHVLEGHNETAAHNATHVIAVVSVMLQVADEDDVLANLEDAVIANKYPWTWRWLSLMYAPQDLARFPGSFLSNTCPAP